MHQLDVLRGVLIPNRDSPNGYPTIRPAELQSVTLSHQVDTHKTLTTHKLACSCFVAPFGYQYLVGKECEALTHSQQQPQVPKTHKKKPTIRQAIRAVFCAPQGPILTESWSRMKSSARHTLNTQQAQLKETETDNLIENDAKSLSRPLAWLL